MQLRINGEKREVADNLSVLELIKHLNLPPERIAIELNRNVLRRAEWGSTTLKEDDHVEIVHFVGGGDTSLWFRLIALLHAPLVLFQLVQV